MTEKKQIFSSKVKYDGIFSFPEFYKFCYDYLSGELGFGMMEGKPTVSGMKQFFRNLDSYKKSLKKSGIYPSNEEFTRKLEEVIVKLSKE